MPWTGGSHRKHHSSAPTEPRAGGKRSFSVCSLHVAHSKANRRTPLRDNTGAHNDSWSHCGLKISRVNRHWSRSGHGPSNVAWTRSYHSRRAHDHWLPSRAGHWLGSSWHWRRGHEAGAIHLRWCRNEACWCHPCSRRLLHHNYALTRHVRKAGKWHVRRSDNRPCHALRHVGCRYGNDRHWRLRSRGLFRLLLWKIDERTIGHVSALSNVSELIFLQHHTICKDIHQQVLVRVALATGNRNVLAIWREVQVARAAFHTVWPLT
mmetsp:Transcript_61821/g.115595  ORF Transcript_61821/g.115595 Transcript_61821/m.115595 type:complete len:264 (-) Transcript_61821:1403-2194(-)